MCAMRSNGPSPGMAKVPRVPELPRAACRSHPSPDLWFSDKPAERREATQVCLICPELAGCREWTLSYSPHGDEAGIVAGMTAMERKAERRSRKQAAELDELEELRQRSAMAALNKAKTCCGRCGKPLAGKNLMALNGGRWRGCRNCYRRRGRESERRRRMLGRAKASARLLAETRASVLAVITSQPGLTQQAVGRLAHRSARDVPLVLRELEADGLITIERGPHNRHLHYPAADQAAQGSAA